MQQKICNVKTINVPGPFMQADMDDLVHVHFTGEMVDKLLDIDHLITGSVLDQENLMNKYGSCHMESMTDMQGR